MARTTSQKLRRLAFFFYGPAQLGRLDDPVHEAPAVTCRRCGRPMSDHTVVRGDHPPYIAC